MPKERRVIATEGPDGRMGTALLLAVFVAAAVVIVRAQAASAPADKGAPAGQPGKATPGGDPDPGYEIGPGDVLNVNVWREPELTEKLVVRPDGMISLPLVGDIRAQGETPGHLADLVRDKLAPLLTRPQVAVMVAEVHSKWFVVLGEVARPNTYPLNRATTVLEAISQAGGLREDAKAGKVYILRSRNGKSERLAFNYKKVSKGQGDNQNVWVVSGDTIVVP